MRFGLPESPMLSSFTFSFHMPMPGAYPGSPPQKALGLSQQKPQLRRQRSRIEQGAKRFGPGPLELALKQIGAPELPEEDALTPEPKRPKAPHYHNSHRGSHPHGIHRARKRIIYIGGLPQIITRDAIVTCMSRVGKLNSCVLNCGRGYVGQDSKIDAPEGEYMATVEFAHAADAARAVRMHHQTKWMNRTILVSFNPWDMPTGRRLRGGDVNKPPVDVNPRPTPYGKIKDMTVNRRDAALWRHTQDRRRKREEQVEQKRAERLKHHRFRFKDA